MTTVTAPLGQRTLSSELRVLAVMAYKEWTIFRRYPTWVFGLIVWPLIFPLGSIFTARALSGPDGAGLAAFAARTGTTDYIAYIVIGLTMYMWINITLWDVGLQLRNEQMRGTLESNWLCPIWRFSILLGPSLTKLLTSGIWRLLRHLGCGAQHRTVAVDYVAGHPLHVWHWRRFWQPGHAGARSQQYGLSGPWHLYDLYRRLLSAGGHASVDAERGQLVTPDLCGPRAAGCYPRWSHLARYPVRSNHACLVCHWLVGIGLCHLSLYRKTGAA